MDKTNNYKTPYGNYSKLNETIIFKTSANRRQQSVAFLHESRYCKDWIFVISFEIIFSKRTPVYQVRQFGHTINALIVRSIIPS